MSENRPTKGANIFGSILATLYATGVIVLCLILASTVIGMWWKFVMAGWLLR